ncbi:carbon storage regulator [Ectopseudomonas guguanensis]|uniref:carbon storage regulator n=1 Tax=Ectopseudomonas guguanensis TaxID=1198456 RepID=UPI0028A80F0D|nr:carbon storage regulator [Pseudomonas guguanensis]
MGLTLTRREGEELELTFSENMSVAELDALLRDGITISVRRIHEQHGSLQAKLHITAPRSVTIVRSELLGEQ